MDGLERQKSLKEWLGLNRMGCCGTHWGAGPSTISVLGEDDESPLREPINHEQSPIREPMNLAMALAAERRYLAAQNSNSIGSPTSPDTSRLNNSPVGRITLETPMKTSLMMLLTETNGENLERESREKDVGVGAGSDMVCCVCMGRKKGAAFIPCGHTFCRVCSRELWMNRGSCPLCNRPIIEILDIF